MTVAESVHSISPSLRDCHSFTNPLKEQTSGWGRPRGTDRQAEAEAVAGSDSCYKQLQEWVCNTPEWVVKASNTATSANLKDDVLCV